jgi:hypothetical protein
MAMKSMSSSSGVIVRTTAPAQVDQSGSAQQAQGVAHWRPRDAEAPGEDLLVEVQPRREGTGEDLAGDLVGQALGTGLGRGQGDLDAGERRGRTRSAACGHRRAEWRAPATVAHAGIVPNDSARVTGKRSPRREDRCAAAGGLRPGFGRGAASNRRCRAAAAPVLRICIAAAIGARLPHAGTSVAETSRNGRSSPRGTS